jgi:hypothetical protein
MLSEITILINSKIDNYLSVHSGNPNGFNSCDELHSEVYSCLE